MHTINIRLAFSKCSNRRVPLTDLTMQSHCCLLPFPLLSNCWHFAFCQIYRAIPEQFLQWGKAHGSVQGGADIEDCCCHEGVHLVCNCVRVGGASQVATHMNAMTQGFPTKSYEIISDSHLTCQDQTSNVGAHR